VPETLPSLANLERALALYSMDFRRNQDMYTNGRPEPYYYYLYPNFLPQFKEPANPHDRHEKHRCLYLKDEKLHFAIADVKGSW